MSLMNTPVRDIPSIVEISDKTVPLEQIIAVAADDLPVKICNDQGYLEKLGRSATVIREHIEITSRTSYLYPITI